MNPEEGRDAEWIRESNLIEGVDDVEADRDALAAYQRLLKEPRLTKASILRLHRTLMHRLNPRIAGHFRKCNVRVGIHIAPEWQLVSHLIDNWLRGWAKASNDDEIRYAHITYEKIHPFEDGNGRTGRCLMNYQRVKSKLDPLCIYFKDRGVYYRWFTESLP